MPQENIDAMNEALQRVALGFEGRLYIFDADGHTESGAKPLIFAQPRFDMTAIVQAEYARVCDQHRTLVDTDKGEVLPSEGAKPPN